MMFYLMAVPLRLLGGRPSGLLVGSFLIEALSGVALVALVLRNLGRPAASVAALFVTLLVFGHGARLIDPWNPFVVVLPFALFVVSAWLGSGGDGLAIPIAGFSGSLAAQSHLGAVPPVFLVGAGAVALRFFLPPPSVDRHAERRGVLALIVVLAVFWAAPLWQQAVSPEANISRIVRFFTTPGKDAPVGWLQGFGMAAGQLAF